MPLGIIRAENFGADCDATFVRLSGDLTGSTIVAGFIDEIFKAGAGSAATTTSFSIASPGPRWLGVLRLR